jgi:hypothetical protein
VTIRAARLGLALALCLGASCKKAAPLAPFAPATCLQSSGCAANEYCVFEPGLCGRGPVPGTCRPRPATCPPAHAPVCGCDGQVHDDACAAQAAGVDLAVMGGCKAVLADWAPCGPRFCDVRTSYCEIYLSDVFEIPTTYTCRALPAGCRPSADGGLAPTCACFPKDTPCLTFCGPLPTGGLTGFHLTCQGKKEPRR